MQRHQPDLPTRKPPACFNPHPARRPDATGKQGALVDHASKSFNPHPARRPDATSSSPRRLVHITSRPFQSSSGQKAGCNSTSYSKEARVVGSGFNPHPARRPDATIPTAYTSPLRYCFNPHPARRPDATLEYDSIRNHGFNPHPARRPDATSGRPRGLKIHHSVSILIRPEGRMQPASRYKTEDLAVARIVSILIRPEGRMQPWSSTSGWRVSILRSRCNSRIAVSDIPVQVSILIRPEGRMQQSAVGRHLQRFEAVSILIRPEGRMQPDRTTARRSQFCFNPHPARRPDATHPGPAQASSPSPVSILIRPEGRMQQRVVPVPVVAVPKVSILIRPEGRMQIWQSRKSGSWRYQPAVSILIRPEGRMQPGRPLAVTVGSI